jgi:chromosome segregation ATPase
LISTKKQELDSLVDQLNIQVENPVCFLNQETSKNFLNTSNSSDKYKLFMKASQLESIKKLQEEIEHQRHLAKVIIVEKKSLMSHLQEELWKEEQKLKKNQSLDKLKFKSDLLMKEFSWAMVRYWEKQLQDTQHEQNQKRKSKKYLEKLEQSEKIYSEVNEKYEKVKTEINDLNEKLKSINLNNNDKLAVLLKKSYSSFKLKENEHKKLNDILKKKKNALVELEQKYDDEKKNSNTNYDYERMEKRRQISEFKQKLNELNEIETNKTHENRELNLKIENQLKKIETIEIDINSLFNENRKLESEIKKLENASKNQIMKYGEFIPNLLSDIQKSCEAGKFRQIPRGPIGNYIQPKNTEWSLAIEQSIGTQFMSAFVCGNHHDEAVLYQLINKHVHNSSMRPRVIVADYNSKLYDVNKYRPENTQYSTVFEMINIKDTVIANILIDLRRIESILLFSDYETGERIIARKADKYCSEAYLKNGDKLLGKKITSFCLKK